MEKPEDPALKQQLTDLHDQKKMLQTEQQEMLVRRYPNDLDAHFELGVLYFKANRWDDALKEFQFAANSPKLKVLSTHYMGRCLVQKKMYDLAIPRFKAALGACVVMDGTRKEILYDLGVNCETMGKEAEAIEHFKQIYEVDISFRDISQKIEAHYKKKSG